MLAKLFDYNPEIHDKKTINAKLYKTFNKLSGYVFAGGCVLYLLDIVSREQTGDIDVFIINRPLLRIEDEGDEEEMRCEQNNKNFVKIIKKLSKINGSKMFMMENSYKLKLFNMCEFTFEGFDKKIQVINSISKTPMNLIEYFDLDYVQCCYEPETDKIIKTPECELSHKTRTVSYFTNPCLKSHRLKKAIEKGFKCPYFEIEEFKGFEGFLFPESYNVYAVNKHDAEIAMEKAKGNIHDKVYCYEIPEKKTITDSSETGSDEEEEKSARERESYIVNGYKWINVDKNLTGFKVFQLKNGNILISRTSKKFTRVENEYYTKMPCLKMYFKKMDVMNIIVKKNGDTIEPYFIVGYHDLKSVGRKKSLEYRFKTKKMYIDSLNNTWDNTIKVDDGVKKESYSAAIYSEKSKDMKDMIGVNFIAELDTEYYKTELEKKIEAPVTNVIAENLTIVLKKNNIFDDEFLKNMYMPKFSTAHEINYLPMVSGSKIHVFCNTQGFYNLIYNCFSGYCAHIIVELKNTDIGSEFNNYKHAVVECLEECFVMKRKIHKITASIKKEKIPEIIREYFLVGNYENKYGDEDKTIFVDKLCSYFGGDLGEDGPEFIRKFLIVLGRLYLYRRLRKDNTEDMELLEFTKDTKFKKIIKATDVYKFLRDRIENFYCEVKDSDVCDVMKGEEKVEKVEKKENKEKTQIELDLEEDLEEDY